MLFRLFTLHPEIFSSFFSNSLIARGVEKNVIQYELVNWREKYGTGNYKQVDDKPFGGGSGMVITPEPIYQALDEYNAISDIYLNVLKSEEKNQIKNKGYKALEEEQLINTINKITSEFQTAETANTHTHILPNNHIFENLVKDRKLKKATIMLTPRGYPLNQSTSEWLAKNFDELNILCGRYEGFDARVNDLVDIELSIGNFVTNGGETPAMCLVESVARLLPEFITKNTSVTHDSFSSGLNYYSEQEEFIIGKKNKLSRDELNNLFLPKISNKIFNQHWWLQNILPHIEHPQYTRPVTWRGVTIPEVLLSGNHKLIQDWRKFWYRKV
jgi:tRNA (guanine37-N1)-methyltransferase